MQCLSRLMATAVFMMLTASPALSAQDYPRLDNLFEQLHETSDGAEAQLIQSYIWALWTEAHDDGLNQLMHGGTRAMQVGDVYEAIAMFSRLIEVAPEFAEAWNKRATVLYMVRRYDESIEDCLKVIELEPRHFGALSGLGLIYIARDEPAEALRWLREALRQNPHMENVQERIDELSREVEGETI